MPEARNGAAISARGLTKLYGDLPAVQNVSFDLTPGEYVALLGRNGAGKTTLLNILALLTRPSVGTLKLYGHDPADDPLLLRRRIGLLGHSTFLYDELTAEENLRFYTSLYGLADGERVCGAMLETVGLAPFARELVRHFSRGMRQRLTIGRLFLHEPQILLLDEPFSSLDDRAVTLLQSLLEAAHERGATIVLCTHQFELALQHATRLLILEKGKMAYDGPVDSGPTPARIEEVRDLYRRFVG
jgi:heme exporter protein A